jgi:hypothetical protein
MAAKDTKKTVSTTTTDAPNARANAEKKATDPVQDENLDKNDVPKQAAQKGAHPVTGDAAADANPEGDSAVDKKRPEGKSVPTAEKTPDKPKADAPVYLQEPSGALDAAERERENTEFKANMPPDRTPDKAEQKINEEIGAMKTGSPPVQRTGGAGQKVSPDEVGNLEGRTDEGSAVTAPPARDLEARIERDRDGKRTPRQDKLDDAADARGAKEENTPTSEGAPADDGTTFRRRFSDSASGAAVDRFRQEILANAPGRVSKIKETVVPPLNEPSNDGQRDWTFELVCDE